MRLLLLVLVIWVALQVIYKIPVFGILVRQKTYILKMRTIGFFTRLIVIFLSALNFLTRA